MRYLRLDGCSGLLLQNCKRRIVPELYLYRADGQEHLSEALVLHQHDLFPDDLPASQYVDVAGCAPEKRDRMRQDTAMVP